MRERPSLSDKICQTTGHPSTRLNGVLILVIVLLNLVLLFTLLPESVPFQKTVSPSSALARWCLLTVLLMGLAPMHWGLLHEAFHRQLHPSLRWNDGLGRVLAAFFGAPYSILKFGHLFHHRYNRSALDRSEYYPADTQGPRACLNYFFRLLGGLYIVECLFSAAVFAPRRLLIAGVRRQCGGAPEGLPSLATQIEQTLLGPEALRTMRVEATMVLLWISCLVWVLGAWAWSVAVTFFLRGLVVSLLDNAFHYGSPLDDLRSAYNARLPRWASILVMHSNYHGVHHQFPRVPWRYLPDIFEAMNDQRATANSTRLPANQFNGDYLPLVLRQLRGPIFSEHA